jgi:hypothetical protein
MGYSLERDTCLRRRMPTTSEAKLGGRTDYYIFKIIIYLTFYMIFYI